MNNTTKLTPVNWTLRARVLFTNDELDCIKSGEVKFHSPETLLGRCESLTILGQCNAESNDCWDYSLEPIVMPLMERTTESPEADFVEHPVDLTISALMTEEEQEFAEADGKFYAHTILARTGGLKFDGEQRNLLRVSDQLRNFSIADGTLALNFENLPDVEVAHWAE